MYKYFITILIIFLINYIFKKNYETYVDDEVLKPFNEFENFNIDIDKNIIRKMSQMKAYIKDNSKKMPEIYENLPQNLKNRKTYIKILYETYVDDFLDSYVVNRFNAYQFIDFKYKYPSSINNKKNSYENIFNKLLDPAITNLYKNINNNLNRSYFYFTEKDNTYEDMKFLLKEIKDKPIDKFNSFYKSKKFRKYFNSILKNMNIIDTKDNEYPFTFKYKNIDKVNLMSIYNSTFELLDNESSILKSL